MNPRKINMVEICDHDNQNHTSFVRELEMAVDALVAFQPAYCAQFFRDLSIYNLQEAKVYLLNFLSDRGRKDHEAETKFHEVFDRIVKAFE